MPTARDPPAGARRASTLPAERLTRYWKWYVTSFDNFPIYPEVIGGDVLPTPGTETTETERFRMHSIIIGNLSDEDTVACLRVTGTISRYRNTGASYQYYRLYAATGTTSSLPPAQPPSWSESLIIDVTSGSVSSEGWYDDLTCDWAVLVRIPAGQWLWLRLRGTSWGSAALKTSIGFKKGNVTVQVVV